jgi:hypothetical protein
MSDKKVNNPSINDVDEDEKYVVINDQSSLSLDDDDNSDRLINLVASDASSIAVTVKYTYLSKLIKVALETDSQASELALPYIKNDKFLLCVVNFFNLIKGTALPEIVKPIKSSKLNEVVDPKYAEYVFQIVSEFGMEFLYELINIANYLQCDSLLMLCCAQVACYVKSKSIEEITAILEEAKQKQQTTDTSMSCDTTQQ